MKKRILAISKRPCFPLGMGGAEISMALLLFRLKKLGNIITIIGQVSPEKKNVYIKKIATLYQNFSIAERDFGFIVIINVALKFIIISSRKFYLYSFLYIDKWKPDFIFTQLNGSFEINSFAYKRNIQTFHFLRDTSNSNNFYLLFAKNLDLQKINFISNSYYIKDYYAKKYGIRSKVSYPIPLQCDCNIKNKKKNDRVLKILFINPNPCKGVEIVVKLSDYFKSKAEFHIVEGWFKKDYNNLLKNPNIITHKKQISLCWLYNYCDILLVPTQITFPEAYCRVAIEGMQHGMTVIASKFSGLIESVADGGILIENFGEVDDWIQALLSIIDDYSILDIYREKAKKQFSKLYRQDPINPIIELLNNHY